MGLESDFPPVSVSHWLAKLYSEFAIDEDCI
jgi:hypothetical protein